MPCEGTDEHRAAEGNKGRPTVSEEHIACCERRGALAKLFRCKMETEGCQCGILVEDRSHAALEIAMHVGVQCDPASCEAEAVLHGQTHVRGKSWQ